MIFVWLAQAAVSMFGWLSDRMGTVAFTFPAPISVEVPFPGGFDVAAMNTWLAVTLLVAAVLIVGRGLYWVYKIIPFIG